MAKNKVSAGKVMLKLLPDFNDARVLVNTVKRIKRLKAENLKTERYLLKLRTGYWPSVKNPGK